MGRILRRTYLSVEFGKALRRPDVYPLAAMVFAAHAARGYLLAQQRGERCDAAAGDV